MNDADITHLPTLLRPNPARVILRPFVPAEDAPAYALKDHPRAQRIGDRVIALSDAQVRVELERVTGELAYRNRDIDLILRRRFHEVNGLLIDHCTIGDPKALLIGAYFSEEYAFEAAALFNPSIVPHPDQSNVPTGTLRFILSLRGVGEGHVSSVTFRTGLCGADGTITLDDVSPQAVSPRTESMSGTADDDAGVRLFYEQGGDLSETVIFPITPSQRHGIEDVRLVRFVEDDGSATYYGTYSAFSGQAIRMEMLRTTDFATFELEPLRGTSAANKGMALFPRRIDGRYAMLAREDTESIWLLTSDDLHRWDGGGVKAVPARWPWEFIQIGNGGSPIEIDEGWLVITHGVGAARTYCLGACLLDRKDPSKLLARLTEPLLRPGPEARGGYVPNVLYTCGAMVHGRTLVLPYAVADSFTTFATVPLDRLLATMA